MLFNRLERKKIILEIFFFGVAIFLGISIAISFFDNHNLWNNLPILYDDYPFHAFRTELMKIFITDFHNIFGFSNYFYAGHPEIHMYPIGLYLILSIMGFFGIDTQISIRIVLFLIIVFVSVTPYFVSRILKLNPIYSLISVLWFIFGAGDSLWINFINYGMLAYSISFIFSSILLGKIARLNFTKKQEVFPFESLSKNTSISLSNTKKQFKSDLEIIILFCLVVLFNFTTYFFFLFFFLLYLFSFLNERKFMKISKNYIYYFVKINIWVAFLIGFWLIPSVFLQYPEMGNISNNLIFSTEHGQITIIRLFNLHFFSIIALLIVLIVNLVLFMMQKTMQKTMQIELDQKSNEISNFTRYSGILVVGDLVFVFILSILDISFLNGINSYRYFVFFECFLPIYCLLVIKKAINILLKIKGIVDLKQGNKKILNRFSITSLKKSIYSSIIILPLIFSSYLLFINTTSLGTREYNDQETDLFFQYLRTDRKDTFSTLNYTYEKSSVDQIVDWIKENTTQNSRILFENSGEEGGFYLGGHLMGLMALWTNRTYIGGYLSHFWYEKGYDTSFHDGTLYGQPIEDISIDYFRERSRDLNIEYIIFWSGDCMDYFTNLINKTTDYIEYVQTIQGFTIYKIISPYNSWIFSDSEYPVVDNLAITQNNIKFTLSNVSDNNLVYYSLHDFPNWIVTINDIAVDKVENEKGMIAFYVKNSEKSDSNFIEIKWKTHPFEIIGNFMTIIGVIFIIASFSDKLKKYIILKR